MYFGSQPQYLIKSAIAHHQQTRNLDQLTQARQTLIYVNSKRDEKIEPFEDVSIFLPHPLQWQLFTEDRLVKISKKCAIEFLSTYKKYDVDVQFVFEEWLTDIQICATL